LLCTGSFCINWLFNFWGKGLGFVGFLTGVFAFFPLIGTMVVWVPLVIYLYTINQNFTATGLAIYSIVVTGNVDYITRLGLLKKNGQCASNGYGIGRDSGATIIWIYGFDIWPFTNQLFYYFDKNLHERVRCSKKFSG
jgi:hypothetical protein